MRKYGYRSRVNGRYGPYNYREQGEGCDDGGEREPESAEVQPAPTEEPISASTGSEVIAETGKADGRDAGDSSEDTGKPERTDSDGEDEVDASTEPEEGEGEDA